MDKKNIATTISGLLILIFIIVIGATLSAFKVDRLKVEVKSIRVEAEDGIFVMDEKGNAINELKVKSSKVGVRPATGEEDSSTHIPSTINDSVGTEGAYATFKIKSDKSYKIVLLDCKLTEGEDDNLENVRIAIMDKKSESIKGNELGAVLTVDEAYEPKETVVVVWLDADTTKSIASSDILIVLGIVYNL